MKPLSEITSEDLLEIRLASANFNNELINELFEKSEDGTIPEEIYAIFEVGRTNFLLYQLLKYHLIVATGTPVLENIFYKNKRKLKEIVFSNARRYRYYLSNNIFSHNIQPKKFKYGFFIFDKRVMPAINSFVEYLSVKNKSAVFSSNIDVNADSTQSNFLWDSLYCNSTAKKYRKKIRTTNRQWFDKVTQKTIKQAIVSVLDKLSLPYDSKDLLGLYNSWFNKVSPVIIRSLLISKELLTLFEFEKIVTSDVNDMKVRAACYEAKKKGVETFMLQQYINGVEAVEYYNIIQDKIICFGSYDLKLFPQFGINEDRIKVGGTLKQWSDGTGMSSSRQDYLRNLKLKQKNYIVFISGPPNGGFYGDVDSLLTQSGHRFILDEFISVAEEMPDVGFVIKCHPEEYSSNNFLSLVEGQDNVYIVKETYIDALLEYSSAVVTLFSSLGMEALHIKKPMLIADYSGIQQKVFDYHKSPLCELLTEKGELLCKIKKVLSGEILNPKHVDSTSYIDEHFGGYAANSTLNNIYEKYESFLKG